MADVSDDPVSAFVEDFALVLTEGGMPRMPARVFARVLAEDSGMLTAAELAETLGVSRAAISGATRYLLSIGMLHRGRGSGARVDHYRLGEDVWYESFADRERLLARWEAVLDQGSHALGEERPAAQRLRESRDFFAFLRRELPGINERWRAERDKR